jgi:CDP-diacylglycerol---glycerol-3-phosphate 3-phosphatidyltransferase
MSEQSLQQQLPNYLTWARVMAIPFLALLLVLPGHWTAPAGALLFCAIALTDWLDGFLARRWQVTSTFGAFLDPVADKLLVVVLLVLLMLKDPGLAMVASVLVIIAREVVISALREWMALLGRSESVKVSALGKWKTGTQMLAILLLIADSVDRGLVWVAGTWVLVAAAGLTLVSMLEYMLGARRSLRKP